MARLQYLASHGAFQGWWAGPQFSSLPGLRNEGCEAKGSVHERERITVSVLVQPEIFGLTFLVKVPVGRQGRDAAESGSVLMCSVLLCRTQRSLTEKRLLLQPVVADFSSLSRAACVGWEGCIRQTRRFNLLLLIFLDD
jgi:hypothetical protein